MPARMQSAYVWIVKMPIENPVHSDGGLGMLRGRITRKTLTDGRAAARSLHAGAELGGDVGETVEPEAQCGDQGRPDDGAVGVTEDLADLRRGRDPETDADAVGAVLAQ